MKFSPNKEESADTNMPFQKDIVIQDECGDSLWDAVLAQDKLKSLPADSNEEDNGLLNDSNEGKQANPNSTMGITANPD